ncbi:MAG: MFS transporter [Planctomycetes bacterium]|nr:MFS transporter [Planctomycetota bacterium]
MTGILIYLFPVIIDMILAAVFFMAQVATAQKGASAGTVANFIAVWAAVYMASCFLVGRVVSRRNCAALIIVSCGLTAMLSLGLAGVSSVGAMYVLVALEGIGMALFFVPFQVFMKGVGEGRQKTLNDSIGLYTFSWSIGYAAGPFVAAVMWQHVGWRGSHAINAAAALLVGVLTWTLKHTARPHSAVHQTNDRPATETPIRARSASDGSLPDYAAMPDLAWMGWVFSGLGCLAIRTIVGLFPSSGAEHAVPRLDQGLTLFILSAVQAVVGLGLARGRWWPLTRDRTRGVQERRSRVGRQGWMYRPVPILLTGLCGVVGLCLFATARTPAAFQIAAACFGVYSGAFFYYLVFHSLVHPEKSSRYVGINETVVGLTSLAGPFLGGWIADAYALRTSYLLMAGMVLAAVGTQTMIHALLRRRKAAGANPWRLSQ